jgi:hypothetical protein
VLGRPAYHDAETNWWTQLFAANSADLRVEVWLGTIWRVPPAEGAECDDARTASVGYLS